MSRPSEILMDIKAVKAWLKEADYVPVVRCGECKHRKPPTDYCEKLRKAYVPDDFYCKYGERKEKGYADN